MQQKKKTSTNQRTQQLSDIKCSPPARDPSESCPISVLLSPYQNTPQRFKPLNNAHKLATATNIQRQREFLHSERELICFFLSSLRLNKYALSKRLKPLNNAHKVDNGYKFPTTAAARVPTVYSESCYTYMYTCPILYISIVLACEGQSRRARKRRPVGWEVPCPPSYPPRHPSTPSRSTQYGCGSPPSVAFPAQPPGLVCCVTGD